VQPGLGEQARAPARKPALRLLLRRLAADRRWRMRIAVTPDTVRHRIRHWSKELETVGQGGGDLGIRMYRALQGCPAGPVVLIGADIPMLQARMIAEAFRLLGDRDVVFGPAEDSGFWLVGVRHPRVLPNFFRGVRWSGPDALADTLAGLPRRTTAGFVERLADVDDAEAYRRLAPRRGF